MFSAMALGIGSSFSLAVAAEDPAAHPNVGWTKQGMDGLKILVDRGAGAFSFLAFDTIPDYLETAPLPAPGTSPVWKYKAIYRLGDEQVGQWSDVVSIPVEEERRKKGSNRYIDLVRHSNLPGLRASNRSLISHPPVEPDSGIHRRAQVKSLGDGFDRQRRFGPQARRHRKLFRIAFAAPRPVRFLPFQAV